MARAIVSAPGKVILAGEHAAVWGRPALVAAVDLRLVARIEIGRGPHHEIVLAGERHQIPLEDAIARAEASHHSWQRWNADASAPLGTGGPITHIAVALALGAARLTPGVALPPLEIEITSAIPLGAGLGSSAALAVAILQGLAAVLAQPLDPPALFAASLEVERQQHGRPSGIDNAAVIHGGVIWAQRTGQANGGELGELGFGPVAVDGTLVAELGLFDSGRPNETTGEVVAAVRRRALADPAAVERVCDQIEQGTRACRASLESGDRETLARGFAACQGALEQLGVVPETIAAQLAGLRARGLAAKISGAGTLSGDRAGAILVLGAPLLDRSLALDLNLGWRALGASIGAPGARIEEISG